ncbi:MAG: hypothetical protein EOP83_06880 [Verrucomicrobiaceae bacterium]|nr:MAG: hypothetical protein EOP83_06880 [Verrucomicrobiaceae bacterium]
MLTVLQQIGIALGILAAIIGFSVIMAMIQIDYYEPWAARRRLRKRLHGMHIVTVSGEKVPHLSRFQMSDRGMTPHWFTRDVAIWLVENVEGRYGCVPVEGFGRYDDDRSYYFERVEDAMMFKLRWG